VKKISVHPWFAVSAVFAVFAFTDEPIAKL